MASELHDGLGQTLTSAALCVRLLEREVGDVAAPTVDVLRGLVDEALASVKTLLSGLRTPASDELGLAAALPRLAEAFELCHGVQVDVFVAGIGELTPAAERTAYRVAQEALRIAVAHGSPAALSVAATQRGGDVTMIVEDGGTVFDPAAGAAARQASMMRLRERAAAIGGWLDVESRPGQGTTVRLVLPDSTVPRR
jgi:signal transduction histidine kinase